MRAKWFDREVVAAINYALHKGEKQAARIIAVKARSTTRFADRSGTLRGSIRAAKSRYKGGGWLVIAGGRGSWGDAWYAPKVELGWVKASARPFMKDARNASIGRLRALFKGIFGGGARLRV